MLIPNGFRKRALPPRAEGEFPDPDDLEPPTHLLVMVDTALVPKGRVCAVDEICDGGAYARTDDGDVRLFFDGEYLFLVKEDAAPRAIAPSRSSGIEKAENSDENGDDADPPEGKRITIDDD